MPDLKKRNVTADEVAEFYKSYPTYWFLLEVLKTDDFGKAISMRVMDYNKNKDVLRELLLEEPSEANSKYIFVYADPDGKCKL